MTDKQAQTELEKLKKAWCKCGAKELEVIEHKAGCPYRVAAISDAELKQHCGQLYNVAV